MELKPFCPDSKAPKKQGINRTFMELKLLNALFGFALDKVLIEPLWN